MIQPRLRAFAGVSVLAATLGLAACGERAAAPAADTAVQTDPVDDTRTVPSEAARAQQSGEAITGPETAPRPDATTDAAPPPNAAERRWRTSTNTTVRVAPSPSSITRSSSPPR